MKDRINLIMETPELVNNAFASQSIAQSKTEDFDYHKQGKVHYLSEMLSYLWRICS
jgi:hypothetical protein